MTSMSLLGWVGWHYGCLHGSCSKVGDFLEDSNACLVRLSAVFYISVKQNKQCNEVLDIMSRNNMYETDGDETPIYFSS